jgi:hypothetical protein
MAATATTQKTRIKGGEITISSLPRKLRVDGNDRSQKKPKWMGTSEALNSLPVEDEITTDKADCRAMPTALLAE